MYVKAKTVNESVFQISKFYILKIKRNLAAILRDHTPIVHTYQSPSYLLLDLPRLELTTYWLQARYSTTELWGSAMRREVEMDLLYNTIKKVLFEKNKLFLDFKRAQTKV